MSGILFYFYFPKTQSISNLLFIKAYSSYWYSDKSDEFFSFHFVKIRTESEYRNVRSPMILELVAWVACFFNFLFQQKINLKIILCKEVFQFFELVMGVVYFLHLLQLKEYFVRHIPNISVEMQENKKSNWRYLPTIPTFSEWQNSSEYRDFVGYDGIDGIFLKL